MKCHYEGCTIKTAVFGFANNKKIRYCLIHKLENMINLMSKKCLEIGCNKGKSFGYPNDKQTHCKEHSSEGMVDLKHRACLTEGCETQPYYAMPNTKKPLYCVIHKQDGMIDVASKKCKEENCNKGPVHGYPEDRIRLYCAKHSKEGMINVKGKKCQYIGGCNTTPFYNYSTEKIAIYCKRHSLDNMIDIKNKRCKLCKLSICQSKHEGYCSPCYYYTYPEKPMVRNHKTKENQIMADLLKVFPNMIRDVTITGGCSKRRPDAILKLNDHNIIIEVDERQHNTKGYACENKRIMEIFQDLGNSPLTIIRFNPDKYDKIPGLFSVTKATGALKITNQKKYDVAIKELTEVIHKCMNNIPDSEVTTIKLRYDTPSIEQAMEQLEI